MRVDVAIAGAGPVGCTLALALAGAGRAVLLVESRPAIPGDGPLRPIALSYASRLILQRAGAWGAFPTTPIGTIDVSQAGMPGRTRFTAADAGIPELGHVASYGVLSQALAALAASKTGSVRFGLEIASVKPSPNALRIALSSGEECEASCLVHAEGASGGMTEKRYGQSALVAEVAVLPGARDCAWERFTAEGPLALLPHGDRYAAVWGTSPSHADALEAADEERFLRELQSAFGDRAGQFVRVHGRWSVPLALRRRSGRVDGRQVYVGNAAQTLHPVAGQGLNLGLRDAWELFRAVSGIADAGDTAALARFGARRRLDTEATIRVTDLLATLFTGDSTLTGAARGAAMVALDACAPARRFFARRMVFGPSAIP